MVNNNVSRVKLDFPVQGHYVFYKGISKKRYFLAKGKKKLEGLKH